MHLNEPLLLAFHDQALSPDEEAQAREHLDLCPECRQRLEAVIRRRQQVYSRLDTLSPGPVEQPRAAHAAFARFSRQKNKPINRQPLKEIIRTMANRRTLIATLAVAAVLVMVFTIPPIRAWGGNFLNMFRVQRIQVFTFDPDTVLDENGQINANFKAIEQAIEEDLEIHERGELVEVSSAEEAAQRAGFTPRLMTEVDNVKIGVQPGLEAIFTIDQPKHQALIDAVGVDIQLPPELDGAVVTVDVPDAVVITSNCDEQQDPNRRRSPCITLIQMPSPVINAPDGLDLPRMGEAMFTFLGLSPEEARQLSQRIDWTTTLVMPIPLDEMISYQEVQVDGVTGSLLREVDRDQNVLIWVKNDILHGLQLSGEADRALVIANSLR